MFSTPIGLNTCPGPTCTDSVQFQKEILKISHCGSRSPKYIKLGHFTLLFSRGRQRNVPRFKTHVHVHTHCSAQLLFGVAPVAVAVVVVVGNLSNDDGNAKDCGSKKMDLNFKL